MTKKLEKGKVIRIYSDPITEFQFEGEAKLLKKLEHSSRVLEYWEVEFLDNGERVPRFIKKVDN